MSRGKKPVFCEEYVLRKAEKAIATNNKTPIKIYSRRSTILPQFVGLNFSVYNGKKFIDLFIKEDMISFKFGEFVKTRNFKSHGGDKAKRG